MIGTETFLRLVDTLPPSYVVPHPMNYERKALRLVLGIEAPSLLLYLQLFRPEIQSHDHCLQVSRLGLIEMLRMKYPLDYLAEGEQCHFPLKIGIRLLPSSFS